MKKEVTRAGWGGVEVGVEGVSDGGAGGRQDGLVGQARSSDGQSEAVDTE